MTHRKDLSIPLTVAHSELACPDQPASVAVPFAMGAVRGTNELRLQNDSGNASVSTIMPTGLWPDHSLKWCVVNWVMSDANCEAPQNLALTRLGQDPLMQPEKSVVVEDTPSSLQVSAGEFTYVFHRSGEMFFPDVYRVGNKVISAGEVVVDFHASDNYQFAQTALKLEFHGPASASILVEGDIALSAVTHLKVTFKFEVIGSWLTTSVQIHNPHRARHEGAIWDLGDDGSVAFSEFSLRINRRDGHSVHWQYETQFERELVAADSVLLQASSGKKHWDSPNHIDASGEMPNRFKGYRVESGNTTVASGEQAAPQVWVSDEAGFAYGFTCRQFWQNFPKALEVSEQVIKLGLFPKQHGSEFELQGGERKQHQVVFSFDPAASLQWVESPAVISAPVDYIAGTGALRYCSGTPHSTDETEYDQVIDSSLNAANGFIAKRDQIDEYGWRNFGEVFADHETLYHKADDIFVSHYNNQYDPIYGFARQYLLTGDQRWYRLLIDLAKHVMDIDIYRTVEDRAEYNNGLFWHTDHYKRAYTCSHRTYSRYHYPQDWTGDKGGGPGSEHCYTSGLLLYYQMTGDPDARDTVLALTSWIKHFYEGTGTVLEAGKRLATEDRRNAIAICKGRQIFRYQYDFDRGVGNYIRALLDSFEVTLDRAYISQAEKVIRGTFGSNDDIAARQLDDIEGTWYYTVFLQEVIRYLDLKRTLNTFDSTFAEVREALLHYARWMADHEQPYLHQPDRLEYPNDTWIAQDIRKANVLYAAYRYATSDRDLLLTRSRYFRDYVVQELSRSETRHFSRIQIILLQNHGPSDLMDQEAMPYAGLDQLQLPDNAERGCFFTPANFLVHLLDGWRVALINFNPKKEIKWLRARFG